MSVQTLWHVTFAHDYATIQITVPALTEEEAASTATTFITDSYGIDLSDWWLGDVEESTVQA